MVWKRFCSIFICILFIFSCTQEKISDEKVKNELFIWQKLNNFIYAYKKKDFSNLEENLAFLDLRLEQYSAIINSSKNQVIQQQFIFLIKNQEWEYLEDFLQRNQLIDSYYFYKEFADLILALNIFEKKVIKEESIFSYKEDIDRLLNSYNSFIVFAEKALIQGGKEEKLFQGLLIEGNFLARLLQLKKKLIANEQKIIEKYKKNYFSLLDYTQLLDLSKEEQISLLALWLVYDKKGFGHLSHYIGKKNNLEEETFPLFTVQRLIDIPLKQNRKTLSSQYIKILDNLGKQNMNQAYYFYKDIQENISKEQKQNILAKYFTISKNIEIDRVLDFSLASLLLEQL